MGSKYNFKIVLAGDSAIAQLRSLDALGHTQPLYSEYPQMRKNLAVEWDSDQILLPCITADQEIVQPYQVLNPRSFMGCSGVGKTSLILSMANCTNEFYGSNHYKVAGHAIKTIKIQGTETMLCIWDSSGNNFFCSRNPSYFTNALGVLLVYDISNSKSYDNVIKWYTEVATLAHPFAVFCLVGNKCDRKKQRQVAKDVAEEFAASNGFCFIETSAKLNVNIDNTLATLAEELYKRTTDGVYDLVSEPQNPRTKTKSDNNKTKQQCCCGGRSGFWKWLNW